MYYCKRKKNHNEKAFSVTMFGFEIKILDKCCVCGKPMDQLWTVCEIRLVPCVSFSATTVKTKLHWMIKHLGEINEYFRKM